MENLRFAKKETLLKKYNENVKNRKNVIEKLLELTKQQQLLDKEKQKVEDSANIRRFRHRDRRRLASHL